MSAPLPARPSLEWLRKRAKSDLTKLRLIRPGARLAEAQLALARNHGFASWRALVAAVEAPGSTETAVAEFLQLVGQGETAAVRQLLASTPALVNAIGRHPFWGGRPQALHVAVETGRRKMVDLLLESGADVNGSSIDYDDWSPLMLAIQRKHGTIAQLLRRRGARVGLIEALMQGDDRTVLRLLKRGRSALPARVPNRGSLLAFARTARAIDRLLALGTPTDLPDRWGATPIDAFSRLGKPGAALVEHLVSLGVGASPDIYARLGDRRRLTGLSRTNPAILQSPAVLRGAVDFRRHALVRWLLQQGADPNMRLGGEPDATALHSAAWNGDLRMVRLLLEHDADRTIRDRQYHATAMDWARTAIEVEDKAGCREVMDLLEQLNGAPREDEKAAPRTAWKPLMDAAFAGDVPTVQRLLKAGADPNVLSNSTFRHRPLHRAIEHKKTLPRTPDHEAVVRLLLGAGANPQLRALVTRTTALQLAAMQEPRFLPLLLPVSGPLDLFDACAVLDEPRVRTLLGADGSVARSVDQNGWSPLHHCAASALFGGSREASARQLRIATLLHEAGADPSATYLYPGDASPISVLYHAAGQHDNPAMVEFLLRAGANPDDNEGIWHASDEGHAGALEVFVRLLDPALLARIASRCVVTQLSFGRVRGIPWLLAHGADPNVIESVTGDAALHAAARAGVGEATVRLLLAHGARPELPNRAGKSAAEVKRK